MFLNGYSYSGYDHTLIKQRKIDGAQDYRIILSLIADFKFS